jgi:hypothetical protein
MGLFGMGLFGMGLSLELHCEGPFETLQRGIARLGEELLGTAMRGGARRGKAWD